MCLQTLGRRHEIHVALNTEGVRRVLDQRHGDSDIRADFAFYHGHSIDQDHIAALLQVKSVGSLNRDFWEGVGSLDDKSQNLMTCEANAYVNTLLPF